MAEGKPIGTMYAEIDLDQTKAEKSMQAMHTKLVNGTIKVEDAYKSLGIKSDQMYDRMRQNASAAVDFIRNKTLSSTEEIARAQEAYRKKLAMIDEQQYGRQATLLEGLKKNWLVVTAAIAGAVGVGHKAWSMIEEGAQMQAYEQAFKSMVEEIHGDAEQMLKDMKSLSNGTIDDISLMQKSAKMLSQDFSVSQIKELTSVIHAAAIYAGTTDTAAFESLADAIANQMPRAMRKMGAVSKDEMELLNKAIAAGADKAVLLDLAVANLRQKMVGFGATADDTTVRVQKVKTAFTDWWDSMKEGSAGLFDMAWDFTTALGEGALKASASYNILTESQKENSKQVVRMHINQKQLADFEKKNALDAANAVIKKAEDQKKAEAAEVEAKKQAEKAAEAARKLAEETAKKAEALQKQRASYYKEEAEDQKKYWAQFADEEKTAIQNMDKYNEKQLEERFKAAVEKRKEDLEHERDVQKQITEAYQQEEARRQQINDQFASMLTSDLMAMATGAKVTFKDIARDFAAMILQMQIQRAASGFMNWFSGATGFMSLFGSAHGNVMSGPGISAYENQIVTKPTFFKSGGNVMGEAGPEAILPLARTKTGDLGVKTAPGGSGGGNKEIHIHVQGNTVYDERSMTSLVTRISAAVAEQVAPGAWARDYNKDGVTRSIVRSPY
jgi:hypothetical protein